MKKSFFTYYFSLLVATLVLASCTSARWTVVEESALDRSEYKVLEKSVLLNKTSEVSPQNPVLTYQLLSKNTYQYSEKALVKRAVQDYKLRPGFVVLGLTGAALAFYTANSTSIAGSRSATQKLVLNTLGGVLGLSGFLNLKPVGEPRFTGEERYLRETGTIIKMDTLQVTGDSTMQASVSIIYGQETLVEGEPRKLNDGLLEVNLASALRSLTINGENPEEVRVKVQFQDSVINETYPLGQILHPYAQVTSPITLLRNAPAQDSENVLAELVRGSQLQIVGSQQAWYKVLYGISENFISSEDAEIVWRSSDFEIDNQVVAVPRVSFGNIDVENNIPILSGINQNAYALVIANENYSAPYSQRTYTLRDGQLIESYLSNALGFRNEHIFKAYDVSSLEQVLEQFQKLVSSTNDSSEVFIYLSGYGSLQKQNDDYKLGLVPLAPDDSINTSSIYLETIFKKLNGVKAQKMLVLADIDFQTVEADTQFTESDLSLSDPLQKVSSILTDSLENAAVIFGAQPTQNSQLYTGRGEEDKKHHIFTYFFAKALQERKTSLAEIVQHLERNVTFTSRKLHDQAQDPQFYGNSQMDLANNQ